jgi:hypothetical protein
MNINWVYDTDNIDWATLAALYKAAPLVTKRLFKGLDTRLNVTSVVIKSISATSFQLQIAIAQVSERYSGAHSCAAAKINACKATPE